MDKFDKLIKEAVESYEAPYDAQAWANVSNQISSKGTNGLKWILGSVAAVAVITTSVLLVTNMTTETITVEDNNADLAINEQPVISENNDLIVDPINAVDENNISDNNASINQTDINSSAEVKANQNQNTGSHSETHNLNSNSIANLVNSGNENDQTDLSGNTTALTLPKTNARFNASVYNVCSNNTVVFTPEDANQNYTYVWDFGDGTYSNSQVASHIYLAAGIYNVTLSIREQTTNKTLNKTSQEITVNPTPVVDFSWEQNNSLIPTINFVNLTENAQSFAWEVKGVKTSSDAQFSHTFRKKGTYMVELSATNTYGCTAEIQKPIVVKEDYNLLAPTAFTPNGDGMNDYFIPEALKILDVEFTMVVYDKSGTIMYQTTEVSTPWDGTNVTNNSIAEDGAYIWKVQLKKNNGEIEFYEGHIIITR